jgi:hypothetical protein
MKDIETIVDLVTMAYERGYEQAVADSDLLEGVDLEELVRDEIDVDIERYLEDGESADY